MPRIGLSVSFEVEASEDVSPKTLHTLEVLTACFREQLEAAWNERLAQFKAEHPETKIFFGGEEMHGE